MAKGSILLFLIFLFIYACGPPSYEAAKSIWYGECYPFQLDFELEPYLPHHPHSKFHPGDVIWAGDDFLNDIKGCRTECTKKYVCSEGRGYASCVQNRNSCNNSCSEEIATAHSVAYHIEDGYYSDGSYYAGCMPVYFRNIHPKANKYKKTEWQADRDECMKLASEKKKYYMSCLKERGHLKQIQN